MYKRQTVTDADAETFYNEHEEEFKTPEMVSAKHILVDSEEKAKEIKEKISNGEISFEEAAGQFSTCPVSYTHLWENLCYQKRIMNI